MKKSRFTEEKIIEILKQLEAGRRVSELSRDYGVSTASIYWTGVGRPGGAGASGTRQALGACAPGPQRANQLWSLDFVSDTTAAGRVLRLLAVIDAYTRECLTIDADTSLAARRATAALERVRDERPLPAKIRTDDGPEFRSRWFRSWCDSKGIRLDYIEPASPCRTALSKTSTAACATNA